MIRAETHSDDRAVEVTFDAEPWFKTATAEDIAAVIADGFCGGWGCDRIAHDLADTTPAIAEMFTYISIRNRIDKIGFEVTVNEDDAKAWLAAHRPLIPVESDQA